MTDDFDIDDGASEVVAHQPLRKPRKAASAAQAAQATVGGKLAQARAVAAQNRQEFTMVRSPLGVTKVSLGHLLLFDVLWRLWAAKRVSGCDPGVRAEEIAKEAQKPVKEVRTILATLIRNGIVRSVHTNVGWAASRAAYHPTELGTQVLGIAQMLGPGTSIQVGGTATAWKGRHRTEPSNIFRHAAFLRGKR